MNLVDLARAALADWPASGGHVTQATSAQAAELRRLVAIVAADWPESERAEALAAAMADSETALTCYRLLASEQYAPAREAGPYTTAPLAERDPRDHRGTCLDCTNLTPKEQRCLAAWRGEKPGGAARDYHPVTDILRRCECYAPKVSEVDRRTGAERWPYLAQVAKQPKGSEWVNAQT